MVTAARPAAPRHSSKEQWTRVGILVYRLRAAIYFDGWDDETMDLYLDNHSDFLSARISGEFELEEAERTFLRILEAIDRYGASKILVDGRGLSGRPLTVERFYYGTFVANAVVDLCQRKNRPMPKFSYVLQEPVLDLRRYGNRVAVARGMKVRTFDDLDVAQEWLSSSA